MKVFRFFSFFLFLTDCTYNIEFQWALKENPEKCKTYSRLKKVVSKRKKKYDVAEKQSKLFQSVKKKNQDFVPFFLAKVDDFTYAGFFSVTSTGFFH